mgnify:FL=1
MLFKFESVDMDGCVLTQEFETDIWMEALDYFVKFLRGSGYSIENNSVGINTDLHMSYEDMNTTVFSEE